MDVVCFGELIADFLPAGTSGSGYPLFEFNPGGAPANVAAAIAKLGADSAFIGKVGDDLLGKLLVESIKSTNVDTSGIVIDHNEKTAMSLVHLDETGERSFCFFGEKPADLALKDHELNTALLTNCKMFHFGARSLLSPFSKAALERGISYAKQSGAAISFDPNLRPALWPDADRAREDALWGIEHADLIKLSMEEVNIVFGDGKIGDLLESMHSKGKQCVITDGGNGAFFWNGNEVQHVPAFSVSVADTTGAGDAFWGAYLFFFVTGHYTNQYELVRKACAAGSLATLRKGAITAQPTLAEIQRMCQDKI